MTTQTGAVEGLEGTSAAPGAYVLPVTLGALDELIRRAEARGYARGLADGIRFDYQAGYRAGSQDGYGRGWNEAHYSDTRKESGKENV